MFFFLKHGWVSDLDVGLEPLLLFQMGTPSPGNSFISENGNNNNNNNSISTHSASSSSWSSNVISITVPGSNMIPNMCEQVYGMLYQERSTTKNDTSVFSKSESSSGLSLHENPIILVSVPNEQRVPLTPKALLPFALTPPPVPEEGGGEGPQSLTFVVACYGSHAIRSPALTVKGVGGPFDDVVARYILISAEGCECGVPCPTYSGAPRSAQYNKRLTPRRSSLSLNSVSSSSSLSAHTFGSGRRHSSRATLETVPSDPTVLRKNLYPFTSCCTGQYDEDLQASHMSVSTLDTRNAEVYTWYSSTTQATDDTKTRTFLHYTPRGQLSRLVLPSTVTAMQIADDIPNYAILGYHDGTVSVVDVSRSAAQLSDLKVLWTKAGTSASPIKHATLCATMVAVGCGDGVVTYQLWFDPFTDSADEQSTAAKAQEHHIQTDEADTALLFLVGDKGINLLIGCEDGTLLVVDTETGEVEKTVNALDGVPITCIQPQGSSTIIVAGTNAIAILEIRKFTVVQTLSLVFDGSKQNEMSVARDVPAFACVDNTSGTCTLYKGPPPYSQYKVLGFLPRKISQVTLSPDAQKVCVHTTDGEWMESYVSYLVRHTRSGNVGVVTCVCSLSFPYIASGGNDGEVVIWNASNADVVNRFSQGASAISHIAFGYAAYTVRRLLVGDVSGVLVLYTLSSSDAAGFIQSPFARVDPLRTLTRAMADVRLVQLVSPNDSHNTVTTPLSAVQDSPSTPNTPISPEGSSIILTMYGMAFNETTLRIWNVDGIVVSTLKDSTVVISHAIVTPEGVCCVATRDGMVRLCKDLPQLGTPSAYYATLAVGDDNIVLSYQDTSLYVMTMTAVLMVDLPTGGILRTTPLRTPLPVQPQLSQFFIRSDSHSKYLFLLTKADQEVRLSVDDGMTWKVVTEDVDCMDVADGFGPPYIVVVKHEKGGVVQIYSQCVRKCFREGFHLAATLT
eukprot:PhF_6_TR44284/c0_g1_i2/m.68250